MKNLILCAIVMTLCLCGCTKVPPKTDNINIEQAVAEYSEENEDFSRYFTKNSLLYYAVSNKVKEGVEIPPSEICKELWNGLEFGSNREKTLFFYYSSADTLLYNPKTSLLDLWKNYTGDFNLLPYLDTQNQEKSIINYLATLHQGFLAETGESHSEIILDGKPTKVKFLTDIRDDTVSFTRSYDGDMGLVKEEWIYKVTDNSYIPIKQDTDYDNYSTYHSFKLLDKNADYELWGITPNKGIRLIYKGEIFDYKDWKVCENTKLNFWADLPYITTENDFGITSVRVLRKRNHNGIISFTDYFCDFNDGRFEKDVFPLLEVRFDKDENILALLSENYPFSDIDDRLKGAKIQLNANEILSECNFINEGGEISAYGDLENGFNFNFPLEYTYVNNADGKTYSKYSGLYAKTHIYFIENDFVIGFKDPQGQLIDGVAGIYKTSPQ